MNIISTIFITVFCNGTQTQRQMTSLFDAFIPKLVSYNIGFSPRLHLWSFIWKESLYGGALITAWLLWFKRFGRLNARVYTSLVLDRSHEWGPVPRVMQCKVWLIVGLCLRHRPVWGQSGHSSALQLLQQFLSVRTETRSGLRQTPPTTRYSSLSFCVVFICSGMCKIFTSFKDLFIAVELILWFTATLRCTRNNTVMM